MSASDLYYRETLQPADQERRQQRAELRAGTAPDQLKLPRFVYANRREPRAGMMDRHFVEFIDTATGVRVEREDLCGFWEWCREIEESEHRS